MKYTVAQGIAFATLLAGAALPIGGCAASGTVNVRGHEIARPSLSVTDDYLFRIWHKDAYPESIGASANVASYAGRITGYACGTDLWIDASYKRGHLELSGYVQVISNAGGSMGRTAPLHLDVVDRFGERRIRGSMGDEVGELFSSVHFRQGAAPGVSGDVGAPAFARSHTIDFSFSSSTLHGVIGPRVYDLEADGRGNLVGTVLMGGKQLPFIVAGVQELWALPPPDQAAILPLILTCEDEKVQADGMRDLTLPPILSVNFTHDRVGR